MLASTNIKWKFISIANAASAKREHWAKVAQGCLASLHLQTAPRRKVLITHTPWASSLALNSISHWAGNNLLLDWIMIKIIFVKINFQALQSWLGWSVGSAISSIPNSHDTSLNLPSDWLHLGGPKANRDLFSKANPSSFFFLLYIAFLYFKFKNLTTIIKKKLLGYI